MEWYKLLLGVSESLLPAEKVRPKIVIRVRVRLCQWERGGMCPEWGCGVKVIKMLGIEWVYWEEIL